MKVVSIKTGFRRADYQEPRYKIVNIMRPNVLSNPVRLYDEKDRERVIKAFKQILWKDMQRGGPMKQELDHLRNCEKQGIEVILLCCCKPLPCHGDVIIDAINWMNKEDKETKT